LFPLGPDIRVGFVRPALLAAVALAAEASDSMPLQDKAVPYLQGDRTGVAFF